MTVKRNSFPMLTALTLGRPMKVRVDTKVYGVLASSRTIVLHALGGPLAYIETAYGDLHTLTNEGEVNLPL